MVSLMNSMAARSLTLTPDDMAARLTATAASR